MMLKSIAKKILEPIGIWRFLKWIRHKVFLSLLPIRIRINALKFVPLFSKITIKLFYKESKYKNLSHSQYGQEIFIYEKIFDAKSGGVFIEIGGNDPVILSNSYFLEKMGWTGLAFEPIESLCEKWKKERITPCYPYVIGDREDYIDFEEVDVNDPNERGTMSSVVGYGMHMKPHSSVIVKKQMKKLENVTQENGIQNVDILFIDVEGFEIEVVQGIDFEKVNINCICVENAPFTKKTSELRYLLTNKGYKLKAHIGGDDVFLHNMFGEI